MQVDHRMKRAWWSPAGPHGLMPIIRGRHLALLEKTTPRFRCDCGRG